MAAKSGGTTPPKKSLRSGVYAVVGKVLNWTVYATEGDKALGGETIQFYIDNNPDGAPETSRDTDGMVRHEFSLPKKRAFTIRAQIVGGSASCAEVVTIDVAKKSDDVFGLEVQRSEVEYDNYGHSFAMLTAVVYDGKDRAISCDFEVVSSKPFLVMPPECNYDDIGDSAVPVKRYHQEAKSFTVKVVCTEAGNYEFVVRDRRKRLTVDFKMPGTKKPLERPNVGASTGTWMNYFWKGGR